MRRSVGLVVFASILLLAAGAWAETITITADDGIWANAVPPVAINNVADPRTARWGTPLGTSQSGYDFSPRPTPFDVQSDGTPFILGTFNHLNFSIIGTALATIDLDFSLTIDPLSPLPGTFAFSHNETTNSPSGGICLFGGVPPCPDIVTQVNPIVNLHFVLEDTDFFFNLKGFSQDGGSTISTEFVTLENQQNFADLFGVITERPIGVPEPFSFLLIGSGLVGLCGLRAKFRK